MGNVYYFLSVISVVASFLSFLFIMLRTPSREQHTLQIIGFCILVYNIGQAYATTCDTNEASIIGDRFSHFGGTHIALCFLVFLCLIARVNFPKWGYYLIFFINVLLTAGFSTDNYTFVKSLYFEKDGLGSIRHITYSNLYYAFVLWQSVIFCTVVCVIIYCFFKKKYVFTYSKPAIIGYSVSGVITVSTFLFASLKPTHYDYTTIGVTVAFILLIIITYMFKSFPITQDTRDDALDNMEDIVMSVDTQGKLIYINRKGREVFNFIPEFVYDMPLRGINEIMDRVLDLRSDDEIELSSHIYRLYIRELFNKRNHLIGYTGIMVDITREKALLDKQIGLKEEADSANLAKAQFLAHMSHEIRTPINAILGMDELILRENKDPQTLEYAGNIMRAGKSLLSIINDILDFSKIEAGKMDVVELDYKLSDTLKDILIMANLRAQKKDLELKVNIDPHTPVNLCGDEVRIKQIITNILTNAIKYTDHGSVYFSVSYDNLTDASSDIVITIQDTGIGIKKEDLPKLYNSFERIENSVNHKIEGTGLGMTITTRLIKIMNGHLDVSSVYGQGSTFKITIPQKLADDEVIGEFTEDTKSTTEASLSKRPYTAPDVHILIVDDNAVNRVVAKSLLKQTKIKFDEASSGEECLIKVKENHYDIILMDHLMPGMSGIETFDEMKKQSHMCEDVPVIALTADATVGKKKMFLDAGFTDYISKPINPVEYEEKVAKYLPAEKVIYS